jgi:hypothetical protein
LFNGKLDRNSFIRYWNWFRDDHCRRIVTRKNQPP